MKISYNWLKEYFGGSLPTPKELVETITMKSFEIESVDEVKDDIIFDVKVLPNRNHDCLSYFGMAREVGAICNLDVKKDLFSSKFNTPLSKILRVDIEDETQCLRYVGTVIKNVRVGPSPEWLMKKLESMGQRSINNIVDATNFVMFSLGQPLHAFDMDKMEGREGVWSVAVRGSDMGEKITLLDGAVHELPQGTLLICDGNSGDALGIAGIKGGKKAEIDSETKNIIVESANFNPITTRLTSKKVGIRTDASVRFENGIAPEIAEQAMALVVKILMEIAGSGDTTVEGTVDVYPRPASPFKTGVTLEKIRSVLGLNISEKDVVDTLLKLGIVCEYVDPKSKILSLAPTVVGAPYKSGASVRRDAPRLFDCSSFVSYICSQVGYTIPRISVDQYIYTDEIKQEELTPGDLVFSNSGVGNIHFESKEYMKGVKVPEGVDHVGIYLGEGKIIHATAHEGKGVVVEEISKSTSFQHIVGFRRLPSINLGRFVVTVPVERLDITRPEDIIEEIGRLHGYEKIETKLLSHIDRKPSVNKRYYYMLRAREVLLEKGFSEVYTYVFVPKGDIEVLKPLASDKNHLRTNLSDALASSLDFNARNADLVGIDQIKLFEVGAVFPKKGESVRFAFGVKNQKGYKGSKEDEELACVIEGLSRVWGIDLKPFIQQKNSVVEIIFDALLEKLPDAEKYEKEMLVTSSAIPKYRTISTYPYAVRDVAVFVPEGVSAEDVLDVISKSAGPLLVRAKLFDVFTKKFGEGETKTSYAFRLVYQSFEKTLSEEELVSVMEKVTVALNGQEGWNVR
ncbi:MAG: phenylalanine--tRNA ligase beta subunit-related protein [Candidatus Paceibacterota bacterium]|jgi:phenylalanyl-tRNA synthetase beta subunit